jgi:uncharacterized protein YbbK (DUF523 family)
MVYLVSACLVGINCRWDGKSSLSESVVRYLDGSEFVPVCPEVLGGLGVPRRPCRFVDGDGKAVLTGKARILNDRGDDLTESFIAGGQKALSVARDRKVTHALLNERSPSCGVTEVYIGDGRTPGMGVTAALLEREGIEIISDETI